MANDIDHARWLEILTHDLDALDQQQPNGITPSPDAVKASRLDCLATATAAMRLKRNDALGHKLNNLEIDLRIRAVNLTLPHDPALVTRLLFASDTLLERYLTRTRDAQDMKCAAALVERVDLAIDERNRYFSDYLLIYGRAHLAVFEANLDPFELDTAIKKLASFPHVVDKHPELLQLHGNLLLRRFRNAANLRDLQMGIERAKAVQDLPDVGTDTRIYALSNLAEYQPSLLDFGIGDESAHLDNAVNMGLEAKELAQKEECTVPDISFVYGALAFAQYHRYQREGEPTDLQESLQNGKKAVDLSKDGDPEKTTWLNNLGLAHLTQFRNSAETSSLEAATSLFELAVELSLEGSKTRLFSLSNLANALGLRFEWTGETETLDIAVSRYRDLASLRNPNAVEWAINLQNLGNILLNAYGRHLSGELLDEAVHNLDQALTKHPEGHVEIIVTRSLLCNALAIRYRDTKSKQQQKSDILLAIDHGESSIRLAYLTKWDGNGRKANEDLLAAVCHLEKGLEVTPQNAPDRALYLVRHGNLLSAQIFENDPEVDPSAFTEPLRLYKEAVELPNGLPLIRIQAARKAIRILRELGKWEDAVPVGLAAMRLLPLACGRYLSLQDQQQVISETSGLASEICSLLLQVDKPEEALRQLEAGRAMLLGFAMDNSDEVLALAATHENLAKEFIDIKAKLRIPPNLQGCRLGELKLRERRAAEADLINCLRKIRNIDGHRDFLLEPTIDRMKSCSKDGAVVIVNISYMRSDAIILVDSGIRVLPLSNLRLEKAVNFGVHLSAGFSIVDFPVKRSYEVLSRKVPKQPRQVSPGFLDWLWACCVRPVFDELMNCGAMPTDGKLLRIWWIGSGAAAGFPFHAAASEFEPDQDALSLSISSYMPSIKALLHARQRSTRSRALRSESNQAKLDLTVITMETTPGGHAPLPAVRKEKEIVMNLAGGKLNCTHLPQPTASLALQAITKSDIVHFACHGVADKGDPSQSHLVLEKPTGNDNTKEVDKLTVSQFLALESLQKFWIAFLSACTTASMGTFRLGDEGLHTSGALQIAGFTHVVGSLWKVEDEVGVDIARVFYENLIGVETNSFNDRMVAAALREAVMRIREHYPSSWTKWAAYIHSGA
ncbi:CHAT domain-containing protein [Xylaria digitata]|nr:CHAT domain-containing protein [Xylaria digitata]